MFPLLEELDMGLVAFSPLANGLLTKCYTAETRFDVRMDYRVVMPQFQMKSFEQNESLFSLLTVWRKNTMPSRRKSRCRGR